MLSPDSEYGDYVQSDNGEGYLESLERTAAYASSHGIPVGISCGIPLDGTKAGVTSKAPILLEGLRAKYEGDFANLIPALGACINDGAAGLISSSIKLSRQQAIDNILFPINGGGLGMAVLAHTSLYATEAGHVEGIDELNSYDQHSVCGVFGNDYTCLEQLGANKEGIETQWQAIRGTYSRAKDIEDRYREGDELARDLYAHSAHVAAHVIAGTARAFNINLHDPRTMIVCQGSGFKFPGFGARIQQILELGEASLVMTKDFETQGSNVCLEGAAYAALLS
jgi:predicted NBD/HSP70 family sugar kinase